MHAYVPPLVLTTAPCMHPRDPDSDRQAETSRSSSSASTWQPLTCCDSTSSSDGSESSVLSDAISKAQHRAARLLRSCHNDSERDKAARLIKWRLAVNSNNWISLIPRYAQFSIEDLMCKLTVQRGSSAVVDALCEVGNMMERNAVLPQPPHRFRADPFS